MRKLKKLSNNLMAILLSASMIFAPVIQSMPVYAAEPVIEEGSADTLPDNTATDESVTDNNDSDTPAADNDNSGNQGTENGSSGTENGDSDNSGTENGGSDNQGTENGGSDNQGTENGDSENSGTENGDSENPGTENEDSENPGTEDGDTENPEDPDAEDGDPEDLGEAEADEGLEEDILPDKAFKAMSSRATSPATISEMTAGGWNESIYAEVSGIKANDVAGVSYSNGSKTVELGAEDLEYLVRDKGSVVRIDIPGVAAGTYSLTVKAGSNNDSKTASNITVYAYDRSGFAHFNYTRGVGAYNNDGTLKDNAIVLYVTDANKNTVTLTAKDGTSVTGIGNILNSVGQESSGGKTSNGGVANSNKGIIKKIAQEGRPIVVRFIGTVSDSGLYAKGSFNAASASIIDGLTSYSSLDNGGTKGDNGHMARIQSGKDLTLEGIGYDATIDGWGFHFISEGAAPNLGESFEVRNLKFINTPEDAIGMEGQQTSKNTGSDISSSVERCWVHHNEFYMPSISSPAESDKSEGDGSVDFKRGQYFTCSYNYFENCHKTNLVGSADYSLQFNLTYHHNYWYMCKARGPLSRNANIHMYNNYFYGQTDYAMNTRANAYIFSEYNLFYACKSPQAVESGAIKSYNDSIASVIWNKGSAGTVVENKSDYVSNSCQYQYGKIKYDKFDVDPNQSYIPKDNGYILQENFTDLRKVIVSQTGVLKQQPKTVDDVLLSDYSMIPDNVNPNQVDLSGTEDVTLTPGKISKTVYAFSISGDVDLKIEYASDPGVLVAETGEALLEGNGEISIGAGTYMIQAVNFQPGNSAKGTLPVFKDVTISKLTFSKHDASKHYHSWKLDPDKTKPATCEEAGERIYVCTASGCDTPAATKTEPIAALGHSWSKWTTVKEATDTEPGSETRKCSKCNKEETRAIPVGGSGSSNPGEGGDIVTPAGDHVLTFVGLKENDDDDFFTVTGSYSNSKGSTTVYDEKYTECLKMESKTKVSFSCNEGSTLFLAFASTESGKKVLIDGKTYTTDSNATVTVELSAGTHEITKGDTINLFYVSVSNPPTEETYYTLSFEYNYDDAPDAREVPVIAGTIYASMEQLAPASFTRRGYKLKGLYTDFSCEKEVSYPYEVNGNATFYADWEENFGSDVKTYLVIFNSKGGSNVVTANVTDTQIYTITEKPTREGFAFAGWYDAEENGKLVEVIDGAELTGNITLYAHWNSTVDESLSLDCSKDLNNVGTVGTGANAGERYITEETTVNGFTIHALAGGVGEAGKESPKYYMTVKSNLLYTNGILLDDKTIPGNNDGLLKTIEFKTSGAGVLTVGVAASGEIKGSDTCNIVLAKNSDSGLQIIDQYKLTDTTQSNKEFEIEAAGTYCLYATGTKGVAYSNIKFTQYKYTILYQTKGGTAEGSDSVTKTEGEEITLPVTSNKVGYTFNRWLIGSNATPFAGGAKYTVNSDHAKDGVITITADYTPLQYTIKYDAKNGSIGTSDNDVNEYDTGAEITLKIPTPPEGYVFAGWKVEKAGNSDKLYGKSYTVRAEDADDNGDITFTAVYELEGEPDTDVAEPEASVEDGKVDKGTSVTLSSTTEGAEIYYTISTDGTAPADPTAASTKYSGAITINENTIIKAIAIKGDNKSAISTFTYTVSTGGGTTTGNKTFEFNPQSEGLEVKALPAADTKYGTDGYFTIGNDGDKTKVASTGDNPTKAPEGSKSLSGITDYTSRFQFGGKVTSKTDKKAIRFTTYGNAKVTICAYLTGKVKNTTTGELEERSVYLDSDTNSWLPLKTGAPSEHTFDVTAGSHGIYVKDGDVSILYVIVEDTNVPGAGTENPNPPDDTYTITYQAGSGTAPAGLTTSAKAGDTIQIADAVPASGYTFKGWSVNGGAEFKGSYTVKASDAKDGVITITAVYEAVTVTYTVTFDAGEGTLPDGMQATVTATAGQNITLGDCTPPSGQKFMGWLKEGSTGIPIKSDYTVSADDADKDGTIKFNAVYAPEDAKFFRVTLDTDGGTLVKGGETEIEVQENGRIDPGACEKPGYVFKEWTEDGKAIEIPYKVTKDVTLKATYEEIKYSIVYQAGNGTAPAGLTTSAKAGEEIQIADAVPAAGYTFKGWSVNGGAEFRGSYTVKAEDAKDGTITVTAVYEAVTYTVTFDAGEGSLPDGMQASVTAKTGQSITLGECTAPSGQKFVGWRKDGSTDSPIKSGYIVSAADAGEDGTIKFNAVYASEDAKFYKVTLDTDGGTLVGGGGLEMEVEENKEINIGKCEKAGWVFKNWTVGGAAVKMPYRVTEDVILKAAYVPESEYHEGIAIVGLEKSYEYTGAKIVPDIGVVDYDIGDGVLLKPGVDYTVKYKDNKNPGKNAKVIVTGKGNYAGKNEEKSFEIIEVNKVTENLLNLQGAKLEMVDKTMPYTGDKRYPGFKLTPKGSKTAVEYTYNGEVYVKKTDGTAIAANVALSNNINKGSATILITGEKGSNNKPTQVKKTFKITPVDLSKVNDSMIKIEAGEGTYSVKGAEPSYIKVIYGDKILKNGTDYTVKYSSNKKAGTGTVTITGKGNYTKKCSKTTPYKIATLDMGKLNVGAVTAYKGIKAGKVKATVVDEDGNILKPAQYTLNVYKNKEDEKPCAATDVLAEGTIYVEAEAKDTVNLFGKTEKKDFAVSANNIAKAKVKLNKDTRTNKTVTKEYTGSPVELAKEDLTVTIKENGSDKALKMGVDYEIVYSNNINKGSATAVIKGIGSYSGSKTIKFKIVGKSIMKFNEETTWDDISGKVKNFMTNLFN